MASFTTPPLSFLAWNFQRTRDFFDRSYVIHAAIFLRVNDTLAMFDDIAIFGCVNRSVSSKNNSIARIRTNNGVRILFRVNFENSIDTYLLGISI